MSAHYWSRGKTITATCCRPDPQCAPCGERSQSDLSVRPVRVDDVIRELEELSAQAALLFSAISPRSRSCIPTPLHDSRQATVDRPSRDRG